MKKKKNYREPVNFTRVSIYLTPGMIKDVEQAITEQSEPNQPRVSITQFIRTAIAEKLARPIAAPAAAQPEPKHAPVFGTPSETVESMQETLKLYGIPTAVPAIRKRAPKPSKA